MTEQGAARLARTFNGSGSGILPDRSILKLTEAGHVRPSAPYADGQVQPASLDLRLGSVAYRVRASFLPGPQATVAQRIDALRLHTIDLTDRRGAGDRLRLYRAADGEPVAAGRYFRHRQSEKLDRPARCVHPRDRRPLARLRSGGGGL